MAAIPGLYKRILPCPPAVEFASQQGKVLFEEALRDGTVNGFFRLIATFQTQAEPAFCGLSTLTVVLNALSIDPGRQWKGPWRWFDESMLDCCEPLDKVKQDGITFPKVVCLAECAGAFVKAFHSDESSLEVFRDIVRECTSLDDQHVIVSYDRRTFGQSGTGHFSPVGGYHCEKDMVLILDVARFKYPPHWVPLTLLWDAINTMDDSTGKLRGMLPEPRSHIGCVNLVSNIPPLRAIDVQLGLSSFKPLADSGVGLAFPKFMVISKRDNPPALLFTLSCSNEDWKRICRHLLKDVPKLLRATNLISVAQVMDVAFGSLPADVTCFVKWKVEMKPSCEGCVEKTSQTDSERFQRQNKVLQLLRETQAFNQITEWLDSMPEGAEQVDKESLQDTVIEACCHGAAVFTGSRNVSGIQCIASQRCVSFGKDQDSSVPCDTTVWSKFVVDGNEQNMEAFVPTSLNGVSSKCSSSPLQPTRRDLLTILLLALPMSTWREITNSEVHASIVEIVMRVHPVELQLEVAHISRQAYLVSKFLDEEEV